MSQEQLKIKMSEVEKFKTTIIKIRDILRSSSITGMDSMRHICLYMLGPYLTLQNVKELSIPEKFAWENRYNILKEDPDHQIQDFGNELIDNFDRLFGTQKFSFDLKSGTKHKEIMEMLSSVNMKDVDLHMDVLGYIYEQHLKTGASAARDLGQFFTDRFICEYMVKLCSPKLKNGDIPESVCDPTMGTGGFLTAYLKHFKDVDWKIHQSQVHGVDHDAKVAGVARLNMFMESKGQLFKHLHTADSLHGGLDPTTYDIILANMPFGLKGLKYKDIHSSIKELGLDGTKSEPLFLQLMMVSLNKGGRCAVVVPDGMLVNVSKCHNKTREYLLENFELKRVIKMKGKFFMNTGIQPSILFFENSGNKTEKVEFWEAERNDKGNFSEKVIISVEADKLDESYSLDMRKYQETKQREYSSEIIQIELNEILTFKNGKNIPERDRKESGTYPYYASNGIKGYVEDFIDCGKCILIGDQGSAWHNSMKFIDENNKFYAGNHTIIIKPKKDNINIKYIYYILNYSNLLEFNKLASLIPELDKDRFYKSKIPIPSIDIQQQIVEQLDIIYESNYSASNMIENLKKQMKNVIKSIDYKNYEKKQLKEIVEHKNGKPITGNEKEIGGQYFVMGGGMNYNGTYLNYNREGESISISKSGASAGFIKYHNSKYWAGDCFTITPSNEDLIIKYLYYYLKNNQEIIMLRTSGSTIPHCKWDDINFVEIHVPSLEIQKAIVERLDKLQEQITCLEQIENQADKNAKFILDSYLSL